jgi:HicA toxin of bacterial toxin-antitoxin,
MKLNSKHLRLLRAVFHCPVRADVQWTEVEPLLIALGAELSEGRGSRVRIYLNGIRAVLYRPHPQKEIDKGALKAVRGLLAEAGIKPEE